MDVMDMRMDPTLMPQQASVISHRQIVAVRLLQMPSQELSAAIARERDTNPAFEGDERESCHFCGAGLDSPGHHCPVCGMPSAGARDSARDGALDPSGAYSGLTGQYDDDGTDPMMRVASNTGRGDGLLRMLCASIAPDDEGIAEYLVGSLDHHGYLPLTIVEDIAESLSVDDERVAGVLEALQSMEPAGIGARGACECLLIQLRHLREVGRARPLAELLVGEYFQDLAFRHFREVARLLGETPRAIEAEWEFIRQALHPFPTHGFDPDFGELAESAAHVRPDVIIRRRGDGPASPESQPHPGSARGVSRGFELVPCTSEGRTGGNPDPAFASDSEPVGVHVERPSDRRPAFRQDPLFEAEVVERQRYDLHVNREYLWARKHIAEVGCTSDEKLHIRGYVEQAQSFISALKQRWDTMQRVSDALIELQRDFLIEGQSALKPLTRADVARRVGLHESTVSRATDGKFVLLPNGRTIPFDDFFDSSLPVKKALRELIATENPRRPLSDEQLARHLERDGFVIARRTIAKYREEEGILPSRLRRNTGAAKNSGPGPIAARAAAPAECPPSGEPTVRRLARVLAASLAR